MTFKVFRMKPDTKDKNAKKLEGDLNAFEAELDKVNMQMTHMLTTSRIWQDNHILLIIRYGPKN
jgi:hypothetical protein